MRISMNRTEAVWGNRYLLFQLFFLPSVVSTALALFWPGATSLHLNLICWGINFMAVMGIFHRFLWKSLKHARKNYKDILLTAVVCYFVYQALSITLSMILIILFPNFFNVNTANIAGIAKQNHLLIFLGTVVLVPIVEETFYRGIIFGLLERRNTVLAYVVSILMFCLIHVMGYVGHYSPLHLLICTLEYIPAGLVMAACYHHTGNILTPTLIHMAVNARAMLSMR